MSKPTPHKHAEIIKAWADGHAVQYRLSPNYIWADLRLPRKTVTAPAFDWNSEYRIKPTTININGFEVPEPCREPLEMGTVYYFVSLSSSCLYPSTWSGDEVDLRLLERGIIHLSKEAAEIHAKALLASTRKEEA